MEKELFFPGRSASSAAQTFAASRQETLVPDLDNRVADVAVHDRGNACAKNRSWESSRILLSLFRCSIQQPNTTQDVSEMRNNSVHVMKTYRVNGGTCPFILSLDMKCRMSSQLYAPAALLQGLQVLTELRLKLVSCVWIL